MKVNRSDDAKKYGAKSNIYRSNFMTEPVITPEGFLLVDTVLARRAVLPYIYEDPETGEMVEIKEYLGDDFFTPEFLKSCEGASFVLEHPQDENGAFVEVTPENFSQFIKGVLSSPRIIMDDGEEIVIATLRVYDPEVRDLILSKKLKEVSQGYRSTTILKSGSLNGVEFDAEQTKPLLNHLALVPNGRAGDTVRLLYNSKIDKDIRTFVQNSKHGENTMTLEELKKKNEELMKLNSALQKKNEGLEKVEPEVEDNLNLDPAAIGGAPDMMSFMMELLKMALPALAGGAAPAVTGANTVMPGEDDDKQKLIGNAAQNLLNLMGGKTKGITAQKINSDFMTSKETRVMIADNILEQEKTIINAQSILGSDAGKEILKYNSITDFKKHCLIKSGEDKIEVEALDDITTNARFSATTRYLNNNVLKPQGEGTNISDDVEYC
jgi:hypothetical protein